MMRSMKTTGIEVADLRRLFVLWRVIHDICYRQSILKGVSNRSRLTNVCDPMLFAKKTGKMVSGQGLVRGLGSHRICLWVTPWA